MGIEIIKLCGLILMVLLADFPYECCCRPLAFAATATLAPLRLVLRAQQPLARLRGRVPLQRRRREQGITSRPCRSTRQLHATAAVDMKNELDPNFVVMAQCSARDASNGTLEDPILDRSHRPEGPSPPRKSSDILAIWSNSSNPACSIDDSVTAARRRCRQTDEGTLNVTQPGGDG
jgi:hypothetical protein